MLHRTPTDQVAIHDSLGHGDTTELKTSGSRYLLENTELSKLGFSVFRSYKLGTLLEKYGLTETAFTAAFDDNHPARVDVDEEDMEVQEKCWRHDDLQSFGPKAIATVEEAELTEFPLQPISQKQQLGANTELGLCWWQKTWRMKSKLFMVKGKILNSHPPRRTTHNIVSHRFRLFADRKAQTSRCIPIECVEAQPPHELSPCVWVDCSYGHPIQAVEKGLIANEHFQFAVIARRRS